MKKTALILVGILLCTALTACATPGDENTDMNTPDTTEHTHIAIGGWERNAKEHWQLCEDGEKLNVGAHTLNDEDICTVCGSSVLSYDDGKASVSDYDEHGDQIRHTYYAADGTKISETFTEYATDADGNCYEVKSTEYQYIYGKVYIGEYNEYGDQTARTISDLDGNVEHTDRFEREYNDEGEPIWLKVYANDVLVQEVTGFKTYVDEDSYMRFPEAVIDYWEDGTRIVTAYRDDGEVATETYYKADGTVEKEITYIYESDSEGNRTSIKAYESEHLIKESEYALDEYGWSYKAKETEYYEDGSKTVYEYDEDGELVSETKYDAEGNEI